jgi:CBS domain-containing protein
MKARELMTRDPEVVTPQDPISRAAQIMRDYDVGLVPVVNDRSGWTLAGVITDRDITIRHVAEGHKDDCTVASHMSRGQLETVEEDDDVETVMASMQRGEVRRIPVTTNGKLVGVIAQADIATTSKVSKRDVGEVVSSVSQPTHSR